MTIRLRRSSARLAPLSLVLGCLLFALCPASGQSVAKSARRPSLWISAYYANWIQRYGPLKPADIDYTAFSHLIQFSIVPKADGTIDPTIDNTVTADQSAAVIAPAHAAGDKVLICVGGENTAKTFGPAITDANRDTLIRSLVGFVKARGYDGIDIDFEELTPDYDANYAKFIVALRAALKQANPGYLLTAATATEPAMFAALAGQFDRIDLMTYDLSGPWQGWSTWYDSPLGNGSAVFPSNGKPMPSAETMLAKFTRAGVPKSKLGIGIDFYGTAWVGADGPLQPIQGVTTQEVSYADIMDKYYQPQAAHWDSGAETPWLGIQMPQKVFITYDDPRSIAAKIAYARRDGLGSVILWELGGGWRPDQPAGRRDPLLQAVKRAWKGGK